MTAEQFEKARKNINQQEELGKLEYLLKCRPVFISVNKSSICLEDEEIDVLLKKVQEKLEELKKEFEKL